ncbi:MAG: hypothetical protein II381_13805, partial [Victivallales bacterium]|nr:hypothetical protein [Victivallales bacterium]
AEFLVAFEGRSQVLCHLDTVCGEFRFNGDVVLAFGMPDDEYRFFVWSEAAIDVGDCCESVFVE